MYRSERGGGPPRRRSPSRGRYGPGGVPSPSSTPGKADSYTPAPGSGQGGWDRDRDRGRDWERRERTSYDADVGASNVAFPAGSEDGDAFRARRTSDAHARPFSARGGSRDRERDRDRDRPFIPSAGPSSAGRRLSRSPSRSRSASRTRTPPRSRSPPPALSDRSRRSRSPVRPRTGPVPAANYTPNAGPGPGGWQRDRGWGSRGRGGVGAGAGAGAGRGAYRGGRTGGETRWNGSNAGERSPEDIKPRISWNERDGSTSAVEYVSCLPYAISGMLTRQRTDRVTSPLRSPQTGRCTRIGPSRGQSRSSRRGAATATAIPHTAPAAAAAAAGRADIQDERHTASAIWRLELVRAALSRIGSASADGTERGSESETARDRGSASASGGTTSAIDGTGRTGTDFAVPGRARPPPPCRLRQHGMDPGHRRPNIARRSARALRPRRLRRRVRGGSMLGRADGACVAQMSVVRARIRGKSGPVRPVCMEIRRPRGGKVARTDRPPPRYWLEADPKISSRHRPPSSPRGTKRSSGKYRPTLCPLSQLQLPHSPCPLARQIRHLRLSLLRTAQQRSSTPSARQPGLASVPQCQHRRRQSSRTD